MVHDFKQSTATPGTHVKKNFQVDSHFTTDSKREWIYTVIVYIQEEVIWIMHFQSIKRNYDNRIGESLW